AETVSAVPAGRGEPEPELADHRCVVHQFDAIEPRETLPRVGGSAHQQLPELDEAALAEPGEVDHPGEGVEGLGGADVVRRLLAPDVLLARLKGEDEAAAAVYGSPRPA